METTVTMTSYNFSSHPTMFNDDHDMTMTITIVPESATTKCNAKETECKQCTKMNTMNCKTESNPLYKREHCVPHKGEWAMWYRRKSVASHKRVQMLLKSEYKEKAIHVPWNESMFHKRESDMPWKRGYAIKERSTILQKRESHALKKEQGTKRESDVPWKKE